MNKAFGSDAQLENLLSSDRAFGLTRMGGVFRGRLLSLLVLAGWVFVVLLEQAPGADVFAALNYLLDPAHNYFDITIFVVLIVLLLSIQVLLGIALIMRKGSLRRMRNLTPLALVIILVGVWFLMGTTLSQPQISVQAWSVLSSYFTAALVSWASARYLLIVGVAFWLALFTAAIYLDDIYELQDISVARRFILQAALGFRYNAISVERGQILKRDENSPIYKIGGPGVVNVHLNSAVLSETLDGKPHVIGPAVRNRSNNVLGGFERLRSGFDLSDQLEEWEIEERTRDGIRIRLKDVKVVFSVYRGGQDASLRQPYPFSSLAIQRLVYGSGRTSWINSTKTLIRRRFGEFIARHTLSEFLAAVGLPEIAQEQQEQAVLQQKLNQLAGYQAPAPGKIGNNLPNFMSRPDIMTELFTSEFKEEAARRGLEIKWIGGGTWDLPNSVVPQRHLEAWKLSRENLLRGSPQAMKAANLESQVAEFTRLVQDVPISTYTVSKEMPPLQALRELMIAYRQILNEAYDDHLRQPHDPAQQDWLRQVLVFLSRFTARWLGGP